MYFEINKQCLYTNLNLYINLKVIVLYYTPQGDKKINYKGVGYNKILFFKLISIHI